MGGRLDLKNNDFSLTYLAFLYFLEIIFTNLNDPRVNSSFFRFYKSIAFYKQKIIFFCDFL